MREITGVAGRQHLGRVLRRHHADGVAGLPRARGGAQGPCRDARGVRARHGGGRRTRPRPVRDPGDDRGGARRASRTRGVLEGRDLARIFAWMRPNDLIWNYVVNNYLLGNEPPAFDILYWNNDTTRLPAQLHADFLDLIEANPFAHRGRARRARPQGRRRRDRHRHATSSAGSPITSRRGRASTRRRASTAARAAPSRCRTAGTSRASSTRPATRGRGSWRDTRAPRRPRRGSERQAKTEGSWWPHWREWIRARSAGRRRRPSAAPGTRRSSRRPALTSSNDS